MFITKRIIAGTLAVAAIAVAPALACAAPAFASENVMTAAAEQDAAHNLAHANHAAGVGVAHAQKDVFRTTRTGLVKFLDDGGHTMTFDHPAGGPSPAPK